MHIDFVSFSAKPEAFISDASFRYRCENLSHQLSEEGISTELRHIESFSVEPRLTHVVFHRPKYSLRLRRILKQLRLAGVIAIADFDDLIFDRHFVEFSPAILNNIRPKNKIIKLYQSHFEALTYFEHISVSTKPLARYARDLFPNADINVLNNVTHHLWRGVKPRPTTARPKVVTYFPGTRSHDRDFWQIVEVLELFLKNNPSVKLLIVGPLQSSIFRNRNTQIRHVQRLPFTEYIQAVSNSWVNLLPLEPTPFNQCKSAIKVIEAAAYNAPTICSPLPDALRFNQTSAVTAIDQSQWLESLENFLRPNLYKSFTERIEFESSKSSSPIAMAQQFSRSFIIPNL